MPKRPNTSKLGSDVKGSPKHVPRRGRPTAAQADNIDRVIVVRAREEFLALGYDAVSMEQVAAAAKVSKGTVYARHRSKEELFAAAIEDAIREWSDRSGVSDHLMPPDVEGRLRYHASVIIEQVVRPDVLAIERLVISVSHRFPQVAEMFRARGYCFIVDLIANDIREACDAQNWNLANVELIAQMFVNSLSNLQALSGQPAEADALGSLSRLADKLVDVLVASRTSW